MTDGKPSSNDLASGKYLPYLYTHKDDSQDLSQKVMKTITKLIMCVVPIKPP